MSDINIDLIGDKELLNVLNGLEYRTQQKFLKKVVRDSAKPMVTEIRNRTPVGKRVSGSSFSVLPTGNLKKSIGTKDGRSKKSAVVFVGPRIGGKHKGNIANILEHAKGSRRVPKSGQFLKTPWGPRRSVAPIKRVVFVRPSILKTLKTVENGMFKSIRTIMLREMKKARKSGII